MEDVIAAGLNAFGLVVRGSDAAAIAARRAAVAREHAVAASAPTVAERLDRCRRPIGGADLESVPA